MADIPEEVKKKLEIVPVARMEDVLKAALVRVPEAITWDDAAAEAAAEVEGTAKDGSRITAH